MSKTEKKQLSTKYKFVYFFSFVANVMIAVGIIIDGISKGRGVPGTLGGHWLTSGTQNTSGAFTAATIGRMSVPEQ